MILSSLVNWSISLILLLGKLFWLLFWSFVIIIWVLVLLILFLLLVLLAVGYIADNWISTSLVSSVDKYLNVFGSKYVAH